VRFIIQARRRSNRLLLAVLFTAAICRAADLRGIWEGNTLVLDVTSFSDSTWLDAAGDYHSDELHVLERYTRTSPDTLTYEATIEDPRIFTRPWRIRMPLRLQKGIQIVEDECEEGENGRRHHVPLFKQAR
jgi:hypothetical protein